MLKSYLFTVMHCHRRYWYKLNHSLICFQCDSLHWLCRLLFPVNVPLLELLSTPRRFAPVQMRKNFFACQLSMDLFLLCDFHPK